MLKDNWGASASRSRAGSFESGGPSSRRREQELRSRIARLVSEKQRAEQRYREQLSQLERELEGLQSRGERRRGFAHGPCGDGLAAPPAVLLSQPLVVKTAKDEFLGFSAPGRRHFSLKDFMDLIRRSLASRSPVEMRWESRDGEWVLVITAQQESACEELRVLLAVRRTTTPSENAVTQIIRLNVNGREAPQHLLLSLFRQIRRNFEG
jgi:hypothetical protein